MNIEELRTEIYGILNPEPDEDLVPREIPHPRLRDVHGLDLTYLESLIWEGSTMHPHTRICSADEPRLHTLTRNYDVPNSLFRVALQLFGDSILAYQDAKESTDRLQYYPPIILTFWSGFETFVRYSSELMLTTVKGVQRAVEEFLQEVNATLDRKGNVVLRTHYQPVLDRYAAFLRYAYHYEVDRGAKQWQSLKSAREVKSFFPCKSEKA